MSDKKEIRQEIVNYLCGEEGLKEEFIDLLKSGGLSEDDGYEIKENLLNEIDSNKDLNLLFYTSFEEKDFPIKELSKYIKNFYANYHLINQIFNLMNLKKIGQNDGNRFV